MFRNYLTIALRNLQKHKFYTFINILGMSVGVAVCMIIMLFVLNETSYDTHFKDAGRIYRVHNEIKFAGKHWDMVFTPAPLVQVLKEEFPEVEAAVHFRERGSYLVKRADENIKENHVIWASRDFFKVFELPVLEGNGTSALDEPGTMAISESAAKKYFPGESAIGQLLILDNTQNFKVTAVYGDIPENSHFHFDFLLSMEGLAESKRTTWLSSNFQTYMKLREGSDPEAVENRFTYLLDKHVNPEIGAVFGEGSTLETLKNSGGKMAYSLQPLLDIHLKSDLQGEFEPNFNITYIYLFIVIALFILVIACINFMNLSTARSANRAKEVGIRKVMGSFRSHLIRQFLMESVLLALISFLIAIPLVVFSIPLFNDLAGRQLTFPFDQGLFYGILLIGAVFTGVLAGIYPSLFLSRFKPISILKGQVALGMKSGAIRSSLVVFQFAVSIILIIATLTVFNQLNYIQNKKIGFNKDQVITIEDVYVLGRQAETFKQEMLSNSRIESGTFSGFLPVAGTWRSDAAWWAEGKDPRQVENLVNLQNWQVDYDYIKTLGMNVIAGRDFSTQFPSDSSAVILNETAVRMFEFDGDPVGKNIKAMLDEEGLDFDLVEGKTVIGIVENFHFESLKENIGPVMISLSDRSTGIASFRFQASDTESVINFMKAKWDELAPGQPFTYSFLDDRFGKMYASEARLGKIFGVFSGFAILIACLGLFALTAFTAEQRTKEIGIRKVLGSSVTGIVILLSKEFAKLVLIAFAIATPFAWWAMNKWLEDYEYKIEVGWQVFMLAGVFAGCIALLTISYQSVKAATSNPVNSLKND